MLRFFTCTHIFTHSCAHTTHAPAHAHMCAHQHSHTGSVEPPSSELSSQEGEATDQETAEEQEGGKEEEGEQAETGPQQDDPEQLQQQGRGCHNLLLSCCSVDDSFGIFICTELIVMSVNGYAFICFTPGGILWGGRGG